MQASTKASTPCLRSATGKTVAMKMVPFTNSSTRKTTPLLQQSGMTMSVLVFWDLAFCIETKWRQGSVE